MKSLYGLLPRATLQKAIDVNLPKHALLLFWFHALNSKGGSTLGKPTFKTLMTETKIKHRSLWYTIERLRDHEIMFVDPTRKGFSAFSPDLYECVQLAEDMKSDDYEEPENPLGSMAYGTLPRVVFQTAVKKKFRKHTLRLFWYLSLNTYGGRHGAIHFQDVMDPLKMTLSDFWRSLGQLKDSELYQVTDFNGEFKGYIPSINEARDASKMRRQFKDEINAFLAHEAKMIKMKLNRKMTNEERKSFTKFATERLIEGDDLRKYYESPAHYEGKTAKDRERQ